MKRITGISVASILILLPLQSHAQQDHSDSNMAYWACDGTNKGPAFRAYWSGDSFRHVNEDTKAEHTDSVINYITWDGGCWQASWDAANKVFQHARFPSKADAHPDIILNYLTWDDSLWTATRMGADQWYHVYVAPKDQGTPKNIFAQISHWLDRNQNAVDIAKVIYEAFRKYQEEHPDNT